MLTILKCFGEYSLVSYHLTYYPSCKYLGKTSFMLSMKSSKLVSILCTCMACVTLQTQAQDIAIDDPVVQKRLINIKARFEQLSEEKSILYKELKKKAIEANQKKKYFTALIEVSDALDIFEDDIDLLWLKGVCHAQLGDKEQAVISYEKALAIHPNHAPSLLNLVEIYFYHNDYGKVAERIAYIRKYLNSAGVEVSPLLNFKYLISLTRLVEKQPQKYSEDLNKVKNAYSYMDDNPYYYYEKALAEFSAGNSNEGQVWIYKAATVFNNPTMIKTWNKALEDAEFLEAHEIVIDTQLKRNRSTK